MYMAYCWFVSSFISTSFPKKSEKKTKMMITHLPMDLMEDILSRVPLKYMRAVRLTCSKWNTLSKSQIFTKMHFDKASDPAKEDESEFRMIEITDGNLYLMSVFVNNEVDLSAEHKGKLTCLDEQVKISRVFHCDGILLCILEDDDTRVVVWNPYLGQTRWIKVRGPHVLSLSERFCSGWKEYRYGIGYEDKGSGRNYKILRFIDVFLYEERVEFFRYEIYDFETGLWKTLYITDPYWRITSGDGLSLKGNSYWCARKRGTQDYGRGGSPYDVICFDYTRMRFGPLLPLPSLHGDEGGNVSLSCLREEKLVVRLCEPFPFGFSYWITTMLEAEKVSWSHFTLSSFDEYSILDDIHIRLSFGGFYEEKKVPMFSGQRSNCYLVYYIGGDGYGADYQERELPAFEDMILRECVCFYVPSLVQIKQPKISYPRSVQPEQARSSLFLSTNSFASLASSDDED